MANPPEKTEQSGLTDVEREVSTADWLARIRQSGLRRHGEIVQWLKIEHGFGHGHAKFLANSALRRDAEHGVLIP